MMKSILAGLFLMIILYFDLTAVDLNAVNDFRFNSLSTKDGLSHNNVECILKDSDGFMWFGTRNGLCRFNSFDFNIYRASGTEGTISGNRILCFAEDKEGYLWIGTYQNGLNRFDKTTETFTHFGSDYGIGERVNKIVETSDGSLFIGSNNGLIIFNHLRDNFVHFVHEEQNSNSINSNIVYDILETSRQRIFISTEANEIQELVFPQLQFIEHTYARSIDLNDNYRKRMVEDGQGRLWIAAYLHGLCYYDPQTGESDIFTMNNSPLISNVLTGDMAFDPDGNLWICTDDKGVVIMDPNIYQFYFINTQTKSKQPLTSDHIYTVYFDDQNRAWLGTFDEGVCYYDPSKYKFNSFYKNPGDLSSLKNKSVISIYEDLESNLWIGTDGEGLYRYNENKLQHYKSITGNSNALSSNVITSIAELDHNKMLIGTYTGGLNILDKRYNKFTWYLPDGTGSINSTSVWNILTDSQSRIWLGLLGGGVDRFIPESTTFINHGPASSSPVKIDFPNVMTIMEDSDGDIWFGTEGRGIYILDNQTERLLRITPDSLQRIMTQGIIKCLYQDTWGTIWIGTEADGLYSYFKPTNDLTWIKPDEAPAGDIIHGINEDNQGNIWLATNHGLSRLNPKTYNTVTFIEADGLSSNEFNQNTLIRLSDGRFAAGTRNGLDIFRAEDIFINQNLPKVVLTKFYIANKEIQPGQKLNKRNILNKNIAYTDEIVLSFKEKNFTLEFAALNYTLPEKCKFAFMLEGFENDWIFTDAKRRFASYANLKAGSYLFRVKASNNDGKWGNNEHILHIQVLPPFYETWWFRILIFILFMFALYWIYKQRMNVHRNRFYRMQVEQERKIMQLETEKLDSELQKMTFHVLHRNRALIEQKNRLLGLSVKAREEVRKGLQDIIQNLDTELSDDKDWKYIEPQLDKVYNNFISRLKEVHPDLSLSEIKIAAYVRMNLSTKEISEFMHKSNRGVENERYRLRKKLGLESNDSLKDYLMNF